MTREEVLKRVENVMEEHSDWESYREVVIAMYRRTHPGMVGVDKASTYAEIRRLAYLCPAGIRHMLDYNYDLSAIYVCSYFLANVPVDQISDLRVCA